MATFRTEGVLECPDCEARFGSIEAFQKTIYICESCDSDYDEEREAADCCKEDGETEPEDDEEDPEED